MPPSPNPSTPPHLSAKASSSLNSYSPEDMLTEDEEDDQVIFNFPRERLNIVENLGSGRFGEIHICAVDNFPGRDDVFSNIDCQLVLVKSLKPGSSEALRYLLNSLICLNL